MATDVGIGSAGAGANTVDPELTLGDIFSDPVPTTLCMKARTAIAELKAVIGDSEMVPDFNVLPLTEYAVLPPLVQLGICRQSSVVQGALLRLHDTLFPPCTSALRR